MSEQLKAVEELLSAVRELTKKLESTTLPMVFSFEDAARQLSVSATTLSRLVTTGSVRAIVVGKTRMISRKELERVASDGAPIEEHARRRGGARPSKSKVATLTEAETVLAALRKN